MQEIEIKGKRRLVSDETKGDPKVEFLINTPNHKQWTLPDGYHRVNSVIYGNDCRMTVIQPDYQPKESYTVKLDHPEWEFLCDLFVQKANRKYKKELHTPRGEALAKFRRLYS
jgi:hypothetical protein